MEKNKVLRMTADEKKKCIAHYKKMIAYVELPETIDATKSRMLEKIRTSYYADDCILCKNNMDECGYIDCDLCPFAEIDNKCENFDSSWKRMCQARYNKRRWLVEARNMLEMFEHAEVVK